VAITIQPTPSAQLTPSNTFEVFFGHVRTWLVQEHCNKSGVCDNPAAAAAGASDCVPVLAVYRSVNPRTATWQEVYTGAWSLVDSP